MWATAVVRRTFSKGEASMTSTLRMEVLTFFAVFAFLGLVVVGAL